MPLPLITSTLLIFHLLLLFSNNDKANFQTKFLAFSKSFPFHPRNHQNLLLVSSPYGFHVPCSLLHSANPSFIFAASSNLVKTSIQPPHSFSHATARKDRCITRNHFVCRLECFNWMQVSMFQSVQQFRQRFTLELVR